MPQQPVPGTSTPIGRVDEQIIQKTNLGTAQG
jgi:hypothetical protein